MKHKVLIRIHTARRDATPNILLQKVLERFGFSVMLSPGRLFPNALRLWKPHVTVTGTFFHSARAKKLAPWTKTVTYDQEGFKDPASLHAISLLGSEESYDGNDLALLWGTRIVQEFEEFAPHLDRAKLRVVGNPKLDPVKYLPERYKNSRNSHSVGVVGRFHAVNHYEGEMPIKKLPTVDFLEMFGMQARGFVATIHSIQAILEKTDFRVSLRPHPSEQVESYREFMVHWFGPENAQRVSVDDSIDFPSWASGQRMLISPSSTSFLEAYLLGIPVVNLDRIADTFEDNRDVAPVVADWQDSCIVPESIDELCRILEMDPPPPPRNEAIERQLEEYCDWNSDRSATLGAARAIQELVSGAEFPRQLSWPAWLVELRDEISFRRAMRKNPLHHNFNFRSGYHKVPAHYDEMVDAIMKEV